MVECVHHFVHPPADGPVSTGICKHCGEEDRATNFLDPEEPHYPTGYIATDNFRTAQTKARSAESNRRRARQKKGGKV